MPPPPLPSPPPAPPAAVTPLEVAIISLEEEGEESGLEFSAGESNTSLWGGGVVPPDGTPLSREHFPLLIITIVAYSYAAVLCVLSVVCMIFNFAFRNRKYGVL